MINGRYSYLKYSANAPTNLSIEEEFYTYLNGVSGAVVTEDVSEFFSENQYCNAIITKSIYAVADIDSELFFVCTINKNISSIENIYESFLQNVEASQNINIVCDFDSTIKELCYLSINFFVEFNIDEKLLSSSSVSSNLLIDVFMSDVFQSEIVSGTIEEETTSISISIPPGSELRIDTENYTVTLDGENVLYSHSGFWTILTRDIISLSINGTNGGGLNGELIYTERWL